MRTKILVCTVCLVTALLLSAVPGFAQTISPGQNPGIFQNQHAPVSSMLGFLASDQGKQFLLHSPNPKAQDVLMRLFGSTVASQWPQKPLLKSPSGTVTAAPIVSGCLGTTGTRFNLEPATNALPQNEETVDFILNGISAGNDLVAETSNDFRGFTLTFGSTTGIYVHRSSATPCNPDFEMGNPPIANPFNPSDLVAAFFGDIRGVADPVHSQFIFDDLRIDTQVLGVGLRRIPAANFTNTTTCPAGTLTKAQAITCAGPNSVMVSATDDEFPDFPNLTQDPRSSGTGAGDIYVSNTAFDIFASEIHLTACKATFTTLADCSTTMTVSGSDTATQFSSVSVVPAGPNAGKITLTYVNFEFGLPCSPAFFCDAIKMVVCTPKGAPLAPSCGSPVVVAIEPKPVIGFTPPFGGGLTNNAFRVNTIPVVANRANPTPATATGQTTFVVWMNCANNPFMPPPVEFFPTCLDSNIVMASSTNLATFTAPSPVDASVGTHEYMPAIAVDQGQNITNIAYYHTPDALTYKNRSQILLKQIPSGSTTPGAATAVTTTPDSPAGDANLGFFRPQYGDYIGVAARGGTTATTSRAYIGHTNDSRLGMYSSPLTPNTESNNHVSEVKY